MKSQSGCPFCQQQIINILESKPPNLIGKQVQCENCGSRGPVYEDDKQAIEGWELGISNLGERLRTDI